MPLVATQLNVANFGISAWDGDWGCLCFLPSSHWRSSSDWETDLKKKKEALFTTKLYIHFKFDTCVSMQDKFCLLQKQKSLWHFKVLCVCVCVFSVFFLGGGILGWHLPFAFSFPHQRMAFGGRSVWSAALTGGGCVQHVPPWEPFVRHKERSCNTQQAK